MVPPSKMKQCDESGEPKFESIECACVRTDILDMSKAMEDEMRKKDFSHADSYRTASPGIIKEHFNHQCEQLNHLVMLSRSGLTQDIRDEMERRCVHIANFAMMLRRSLKSAG